MAVLTPQWQALTPETRQAFQLAATLPFIQRYYLAGGTGLALHLGHRFSIDLDFFSAAPDAVGPDERAVLRTVCNIYLLSSSSKLRQSSMPGFAPLLSAPCAR